MFKEGDSLLTTNNELGVFVVPADDMRIYHDEYNDQEFKFQCFILSAANVAYKLLKFGRYVDIQYSLDVFAKIQFLIFSFQNWEAGLRECSHIYGDTRQRRTSTSVTSVTPLVATNAARNIHNVSFRQNKQRACVNVGYRINVNVSSRHCVG